MTLRIKSLCSETGFNAWPQVRKDLSSNLQKWLLSALILVSMLTALVSQLTLFTDAHFRRSWMPCSERERRGPAWTELRHLPVSQTSGTRFSFRTV